MLQPFGVELEGRYLQPIGQVTIGAIVEDQVRKALDFPSLINRHDVGVAE